MYFEIVLNLTNLRKTTIVKISSVKMLNLMLFQKTIVLTIIMS